MRKRSSAFLIVAIVVLLLFQASCTHSRLAHADNPELLAAQALNMPDLHDQPNAEDKWHINGSTTGISFRGNREASSARKTQSNTGSSPLFKKKTHAQSNPSQVRSSKTKPRHLTDDQDLENIYANDSDGALTQLLIGLSAAFFGFLVFFFTWEQGPAGFLSSLAILIGVALGIAGAFRLMRQLRAGWKTNKHSSVSKVGLFIILWGLVVFLVGIGLITLSVIIKNYGFFIGSIVLTFTALALFTLGLIIYLLGLTIKRTSGVAPE